MLLTVSCSNFGPQRVVSSHTAYNDAVQLTVTREVLANIVRSRYADPIQFIAVSTINAQFSINAGSGAGVGGIGQSGVVGSVDSSIGYSDSPTITYSPQSDAGFYKSFYSPFDVSESIGFGLSYRFARMDKGWHNLSMLFIFASINGANDFIGGQINEQYVLRIRALAKLLELGATFNQVPDWDYDTISFPKDKFTGEDKIDAFNNGFYLVEDGEGMVRLARYRLVLALMLPDQANPETQGALEVLGVPPGKKYYVLRPPLHASPGALDSESIWVSPRSMADMLSLATHFVEVPEAHRELIQPAQPLMAETGMAVLVKIRSSKDEPSFPYKIQHRGYWFYVDDTERMSKMFLESMVAAYSSRVGSRKAEDDSKPQVVLPVGGG